MPTITADRLIVLLEQFVRSTGQPVDLLLIGALAMQCYGARDRFTNDVDGELAGSLAPLVTFLANEGIPADLTQDISGWSVVAMPPGYRDRATDLLNHPNLRIRLLDPVDFVIAKLRRGIELYLDEAMYIVRRFQIPTSGIELSADAAIAASPQDTTLFLVQKTVELFCRQLSGPTS
ncbi:MAG: hypothetical protein H0X01_07940 [Nitrospira sp.]|nr:hypothetical protein [Nitrospira sp.]